jgi:hypothetical protein
MKRSLLSVLAALPVLAGDFINLTFDEPDLSGSLTPIFPDGPLLGNTAQILRGWTVLADNQSQATMTYSPNNIGSSGDVASLVANSPAESQTVFGANTLYLRSDHTDPGGGPVIRVQQTGTVPADAAGLWIFATGGSPRMFINGERVNDPRIGALADPVVDVSRYAGQTIDLEFLVPRGGSTRLDIIGWVAVPEPSTWALFGVGAALVFCVGRRKT